MTLHINTRKAVIRGDRVNVAEKNSIAVEGRS